MKEKKQQIYKRSRAVLFFKKVLFILQSVLPKSWYNLFYKFTFRTYKTLIRIAYFRFCIYYKIRGDEEKFKEAKTIFKVMPYSLVGSAGLSQTYNLVAEIKKNNLKGDLVECGVAQGGSSALMALKAFENCKNGRKIWLFDSFEGLPEASGKDFKNGDKGDFIRPLDKGSCLGTIEQVERLFSKLGIDKKNVIMIKGWFQETLPEYKNKINKISLLRIDADWYESTKCCLDNLYDNVIDEGFIVIDDYGTCFGAKKALDEFLTKKKLQVRLIHDGRGGCYFKKTS